MKSRMVRSSVRLGSLPLLFPSMRFSASLRPTMISSAVPLIAKVFTDEKIITGLMRRLGLLTGDRRNLTNSMHSLCVGLRIQVV